MPSKKSTSTRAHDVVLSLRYPTIESARHVHRAIEPEIGDIDGDRTSGSVGRDGTELVVRIDADDLVALRAGLTTWTTLVTVAEAATGLESPSETVRPTDDTGPRGRE